MELEGQNQPIDKVVETELPNLLESDKTKGIIAEKEIESQGKKLKLRYTLTPFRPGHLMTAKLSLFSANPLEASSKHIVNGMNMRLEENELSAREIVFEPHPTVIEATGEIATRPGYEGNGYAMALGLASNTIIEDVMQRASGQFDDREVVGVLVDDAHPAAQNSPNRQGWTSKLAKELGYSVDVPRKGLPTFTKTYY
jgi:hypothetical protein